MFVANIFTTGTTKSLLLSAVKNSVITATSLLTKLSSSSNMLLKSSLFGTASDNISLVPYSLEAFTSEEIRGAAKLNFIIANTAKISPINLILIKVCIIYRKMHLLHGPLGN